MADLIENNAFFGGKMNKDSSPELLPDGEYRDAVNMTPVDIETGSVGNLSNIPSNVLSEYTFDGLTADPFIRVIGSHLDLKRRRVYILVYGQNGTAQQFSYVLYYSYDTDEITTVFSDGGVIGAGNPLEFDPDFTISNINIIYDDELGDTLYWTDTNTEPKALNVTAAENRYNNFTTKTSGFLEGEIVFANGNQPISSIRQFVPCRALTDTSDYPEINYTTGDLNTTDWETLAIGQCYPPSITNTLFYQRVATPYWSPSSTYTYDDGTGVADGSATFLRRRSFQVAYAYVYFDGRQSELSPFSEAVFSQELTSGIFTVGTQTANPDFPTPLGIDVKVPIHSFRYTDVDDIESFTEFPHAMIARVKLFIREVPQNEAPTDWLQWEDIPYDEFYKYNLSSSNIATGFPVSGDAGTYYYDWFTRSYGVAPAGEVSQITTITARYDGSQTLTPVDIKYASTNSYSDPKRSGTQDVSNNRIIHGKVTDGLNISREVIQSIEDNITVSALATDVDINPTPSTNTINLYNDTPTSESVLGDVYTGVYDLQSPLVIGDFDTSLQYDFTFRVFGDGGGSPFDPFSFYNVSGSSNGVPDDFATFEEFVETIVLEALPSSSTASVDNSTGELTITITRPSSVSGGFTSTIVSNDGFFEIETYLPFRTHKNHSTQQYGFVFRDQLGRPTPVITSDNFRLEIPHFIDDATNLPRTYTALINNLADITLPEEVRTIDIVRKRSESWRNFAQFAISSTNTFTESWNYTKPYSIGFENLDIDSSITEQSVNNKNLYITLNSINGGDGLAYGSLFDNSVLNFVPQAGDVLRFLYKYDDTGENIDAVYNSSFNISRYDERTNSIVLDFGDVEDNEPALATYLQDEFDNAGGSEWTVRVLCEVIQKTTQSDQELYWETAAQLSVTNGLVDIKDIPVIQSDSIQIFGDSYLKLRGYCVNYIANGGNNVLQNFILQDPNFNDFAETANTGQGRPNQQVRSLRRGQNEYVEVTRDNLLRYSEQSIQNTDVRRYNQYFDENIAEVENPFGSIEKIYSEGDKVYVYMEDKIVTFYVGRNITTELSGDQRILASQDSIFSVPIYSDFDGGISTDRDSFAARGYQKYFTDSKRGAVYRQSLDGITPISEVGMSGFFKDLFRDLKNTLTPPLVRGIVDERTDEYILSVSYSKALPATITSSTPLQFTFNAPTDGVDYTAFKSGDTILIDVNTSGKFVPTEFSVAANETTAGVVTVSQKPPELPVDTELRVNYPVNLTLIWSERTKGWTTFLSMTPEWLESGIQSYHSFFNGQLYNHDLDTTTYCNFFGTDYEASVQVVSNDSPTIIKEYRVARVKTDSDNVSVLAGDILTQTNQLSEIPASSWTKYEGELRSPFYRDANQNLQSGARLKGRWLSIRITFESPEINENNTTCFSIATKAIDSPESF